MISLSRLLCDYTGPGDHLRFEKRTSPRPIVVWNCTKRCNLRCVHCYASATGAPSPAELDTNAGKALIRSLAAYDVPVLLFSGGEPLMRPDLFELAGYARDLGLRLTLSTNGTLITPEIAQKLKDLSFAEIGISLDGIGAKNDTFRGKQGAFADTLAGYRACTAAGLRVSLRLTMTRFNVDEIPGIFQLVEDEKIDRICFYHLAYSGRADAIKDTDLSAAQTREAIDLIARKTVELSNRGIKKEILTVGNHADAVHLYLEMKKKDPARAAKMLDLMRINGGNAAGIKIGAVDELGQVHADQFWRQYSFGNVTKRPFGEIWTDISDPLMFGLKNRRTLLKGKCSKCNYMDICNGNLRERAEAVSGNVWGDDPACYLTEAEIAS